jgi:hypothetical protein
MIELNFEYKDLVLTFGDVKENQFFIDKDGWLCQKFCYDGYCAITNERGEPLSLRVDNVSLSDPVRHIYPRLAKITAIAGERGLEVTGPWRAVGEEMQAEIERLTKELERVKAQRDEMAGRHRAQVPQADR